MPEHAEIKQHDPETIPEAIKQHTESLLIEKVQLQAGEIGKSMEGHESPEVYDFYLQEIRAFEQAKAQYESYINPDLPR